MKIHLTFGLTLLAFTSLLADFHEPVVNFTYAPTSDSKFLLSINHQSTLSITDSTNLMLYGHSNVDKSAKFHHELGIGFRKHFEDFGIGLNIVSNHFNKLNKFNHQFVPGFEIFVGDFQISVNRYIPLRSVVKTKYNPTLVMYDVTEVSLMYRFAFDYEVGVSPYLVHQTGKKGITGHFSMYIHENWKLSINPFYHSDEKGGSLSVGFDFGGPKTRWNAPIQKSHRFFYSAPTVPSKSSKAEITSITPLVKEEPVVSNSGSKGMSKPVENPFVEVIKKKPDGDVVVRAR